VTSFVCEPHREAARIYWPESCFWTLSKDILLEVGETQLETLQFEFPAGRQLPLHKAQLGVVASGNLEVLMEPVTSSNSTVRVRTSVTGFQDEWMAILRTFFQRHDVAVAIEINDGGASPPIALLRLEQVFEECKK
jgi:malonate decarboxylase delta subunit